jgi:radical SAM protein with 4Fe4S-binding SPASM domain
MIGSEFTREDILQTAREGRLLSMEIELSLRCNYRCRYCYLGEGQVQRPELTAEECRSAILQAKALGARKIIVLGGEPMIYPSIFETLAFICEQCLAVEIFTNGTGMTPEAARRLFDLGAQVVLKMNSFDEAVQDELAGVKGAYRTIQEAFRNLRAAGFPAPGHLLAVSTVICAPNLAELPRLWQWLRDQGISPYFEVITPQGNARRNLNLEVEPDALHRLFTELAEIDRRKYGLEWEPQPPLVGNQCLRHQFSCLVNAFGDVMPCVGVSLPVGNVRERKLAEILQQSEVMADLRRYPETIQGPCADCFKAADCYGCRGAAYQMTGNYLASDPLCWHNADKTAAIGWLPAGADAFVPHAAPMRVVDRLLSVGERVADVEAVIPPGHLLARADGTVDPAAFVEIIAQGAATLNGFRASRRCAAPEGYLIGAQEVTVLGEARAGEALRVHVFKSAKLGDFGVVEGSVYRGEELLATGSIKVWHQTGKADSRPVPSGK